MVERVIVKTFIRLLNQLIKLSYIWLGINILRCYIGQYWIFRRVLNNNKIYEKKVWSQFYFNTDRPFCIGRHFIVVHTYCPCRSGQRDAVWCCHQLITTSFHQIATAYEKVIVRSNNWLLASNGWIIFKQTFPIKRKKRMRLPMVYSVSSKRRSGKRLQF